MARFFLRMLMVPVLTLALGAAVTFAQSSDARLVGTWNGKAGEDTISITFNADGSAMMGDQTGAQKGGYTADFSKSPGTLTLTSEKEQGKMLSLIEFVDDDHVRISQPNDQLPASMAEGNAVVFERAK